MQKVLQWIGYVQNIDETQDRPVTEQYEVGSIGPVELLPGQPKYSFSMSKVKVYMSESWCTYRRSHTIEIDTDDYKELKGMTDEEAYDYLSENMWEFEMKKEEGDKYSSTLVEELQEDWIREKIYSEETDLHEDK